MFDGDYITGQGMEQENSRLERSIETLPGMSIPSHGDARGTQLVTDVMARFDQRLRRYLSRCLGPDASEDALHDVYVRLTRLAEGDPPPEFNLTYVFKTANSVLGDLYRRKSAREGHSQISLEDTIADEAPSAFESLRWRQNKDLLLKALQRLRPDERVVLIMHRVEGVKLIEIAKHRGIPLRTVQRLLADALAKCRISLKDSGCFDQ